MRAAYLGPPGTFSEEALSAAAPEFEAVPVATLRDVVLAVQRGTVERAIVPFENALEGGVDPVLDTLALEAPDVALIGEHVQPVVHNLMAPDGLALEEIETVLSHPQALAQCARWLADRLPRAPTVPTASAAGPGGPGPGPQGRRPTPCARSRATRRRRRGRAGRCGQPPAGRDGRRSGRG